MKSIGIICEYNPFHNGHKYHIEQVKKLYPDAKIVAIMSGHFVQRGEPAFINKFIRTEMALDYVDLVVELPQIFAVSYADDFARGGVTIARLLGLDGLTFGSESGDMGIIDTEIHPPSINDIRTGAAYPKLIGAGLLSNDILAFTYLKASREIYPALSLIPIKRISNDYLDNNLTGKISSATAIRKNYFENKSIDIAMPRSECIDNAVQWRDYFVLLKYRILTMDVEALSKIYTMYEGLENRLKKVINEVKTFDALVTAMVSKRYTRSRILRLFVYILLNIKEDDVNQLKAINAIRVLGMNDAGRKMIKNIKHIDIITNVNRENKHHFELELRATAVYNLIARSNHTDFNTPVIYKKG
ncbi:nucleotidyltransferase family protein [Macrococcoides caseolyticum]|uniref:tRNA(Met) cytidine acetate ligase n=1 Tax=Macrococcoides caseolyticum TaxID=69966 RepID=UPI001F264EA2|nr:nucleotidyltransferase family protein [Macrococcus caseolyticus]MCE4956880.1 nucleotidyltransferase family protein [Macrococcus caseolyticus]